MSAWHTREVLKCPKCGYDVGQTLADGFEVCPECGAGIDEATCARDVEMIGARARVVIYWLWVFPVIVGWCSLTDGRLLAGSCLVSVSAVYGTWFWIERWLEPLGAWRRAIGPAVAVLMLEVLAWGLGVGAWTLVAAN